MSHSYDTPPSVLDPSGSQPNGSLSMKKPTIGIALHDPSNGFLCKTTHNPNARATQKYSIVEDLAQAPCAMSALEVLRSCPTQRKALLMIPLAQSIQIILV